jgi:hypothetical protein
VRMSFLGLLEQGDVLTHINALLPDVIVPKMARHEHLVLQIGLNLPVPITGLGIDSEGITGTFTFDRQPYWCNIPWTAVFAIEPVGRPQETLVRNIAAADSKRKRPQGKKAEKPYLKLIK